MALWVLMFIIGLIEDDEQMWKNSFILWWPALCSFVWFVVQRAVRTTKVSFTFGEHGSHVATPPELFRCSDNESPSVVRFRMESGQALATLNALMRMSMISMGSIPPNTLVPLKNYDDISGLANVLFTDQLVPGEVLILDLPIKAKALDGCWQLLARFMPLVWLRKNTHVCVTNHRIMIGDNWDFGPSECCKMEVHSDLRTFFVKDVVGTSLRTETKWLPLVFIILFLGVSITFFEVHKKQRDSHEVAFHMKNCGIAFLILSIVSLIVFVWMLCRRRTLFNLHLTQPQDVTEKFCNGFKTLFGTGPTQLSIIRPSHAQQIQRAILRVTKDKKDRMVQAGAIHGQFRDTAPVTLMSVPVAVEVQPLLAPVAVAELTEISPNPVCPQPSAPPLDSQK